MNQSPRSAYAQVALELSRKIKTGAYQLGERLPSEEALATEYGVDRSTAHDGLHVLVARGELLLTGRGKGGGYRVPPIAPLRRDATARYLRTSREHGGAHGAFAGEVLRLGYDYRSDLTVSRVPVPDAAAEPLGLEPDTEVIARARQMYVILPDGEEVHVQDATSYIPLKVAGVTLAGTVMEEQDSGEGGIVSRFADLGLPQVRMSERIKNLPPTPQQARDLGVHPSQRLYLITHVGYTTGPDSALVPVEACIHEMPAHYWDLEYRWDTRA